MSIDRAKSVELARQWAEVLNRGRPGARGRAARELTKMGAEAAPAIDSLLLALSDGDATVRLHAAQAIGSTGVSPDRCIPALNAILDDEDSHVRYAAEHALARFAMQPVKLSDAKTRLQHLATTSKELKASCQSLSNRLVVDEAVARLQRLLGAHSSDEGGFPVLPRSNSPALALSTGLGDSPRVELIARKKATPVSKGDLESRILRFESAEPIERLRTIDMLGFHSDTEPSRLAQIRADLLTSVLRRKDLAELDLISVRWPQAGKESFRKVFQRAAAQQVQPKWMARVLKEVRCEQYPDLLRLIQIVENKQNPLAIKTAALGALGRTSILESPVLDVLHRFAFESEQENRVRLYALDAIGELGTKLDLPSKMVTRLWMVLEDPEQAWEIRMASVRCLAKASAESSRLEEAFFALLKHPHQDEEIAVALKVIPRLAVEKRHASVMVTALSQELQASDESLRLLALRSARRVGPDAELIQAMLLRLAANGETEAVTAEILQTLVQFGPESFKKVSEILSNPRLRDARQIELLDGLAGLGEAAFPLLSDCCELVRDQRQGVRVRVAAAVVLGKIGGRALGCQKDLEEFYAQVSHPSARAIVQIAMSELTGGKFTLEMRHGPSATSRLYARFLEGDKSICPLLVSLLAGPDAEYASEAILDLGEPAADSLENLLSDETADLETRTVAARLLTRLPNKSYRRLIDHVDEPGIGEVCEKCLVELEVKDKETEFVHNFAMKLHEAKDVSQRRELKTMAQDVVLASASVAAIDNVSGSKAGMRLVGRLREDIAPNLVVAARAEPETTLDELASSGWENMTAPPVSAFPALPSLAEWPAASDA
ncbi:MAG: HEAT repeat domain-containing protein, partial [Planctomycetota bacterium]